MQLSFANACLANKCLSSSPSSQGWLVCEDHSCQFQTRNIPVVLEEASPRCPGCQQGRLREEVGQ